MRKTTIRFMNNLLNLNKGRWFMVDSNLVPQMLHTLTVAVRANQEDVNQESNPKF
jgi:hypothetical protein